MHSSPGAGGALRLTGRDALAVLHRISTQRLDDLAAGEARTTLFCDFRGRLLHRATVAHAPGGAVWLLRDDAPGGELAAFLDRAVFREDVRIEDRSAERPVRLVRETPDACAFAADGAPTLVPEGSGFALRTGAEGAGETALAEVATLALGRARHGFEITDAFTPFEVNLAQHVHLAKGCFTGQEVLQRLVTYDSVRRGLVRLSGEGPPPAPQDVLAAGSVAGPLTRSAASGSGWVALAVLRIAALERGEPLSLAGHGPLAPPFVFPRTRALGRP